MSRREHVLNLIALAVLAVVATISVRACRTYDDRRCREEIEARKAWMDHEWMFGRESAEPEVVAEHCR